MAEQEFDLIIAGAGAIGVCTALWAQKAGLKVLLTDPAAPGSGTVSGSAGTIATYACLPVNSPSVISGLPNLLTSPDSPLSLNPMHAVTHPRWMLSFLRNCTSSRVDRITRDLGALLRHADDGLSPLIEEAGAQDLMVANDALYVWSTQSAFEAAKPSNEKRRAEGVDFEELSPEQIRDLEPNLKLRPYRGLRFNGARHTLNPQALMERFHKRFLELGGQWEQQATDRCSPKADGVEVHLADGQTRKARKFVVAAGARSTRIKGTGAERLPLGVERGYHVMYPQQANLIARPIGWAEAGFYATPMAEGLRIAGTVEIADLDAPLNPKRIAYLSRKATEMLGSLGQPTGPWLGYRPTFPDAMPVIGPSPASENILLAFGHQHIGLTLGGITGKVISALATDAPAPLDLSPFTPKRF
jgi:D-amino-acid dehydrogenase